MFNIRTLFNIFIFTGLAFAISSCSKLDDDYSNSGDLTDAAAVGIVHASAGSPSLDVALDDNRLGLNYFNYTDRVSYFRAYTGTRNFNVYAAGYLTSVLYTKSLVFEAGKYYTVFIVDTASKMDAVLVRDSSGAAGQDSVRLRFANMSPDAPALDLYIKGNATPIATNITAKTAGNFFSYPSAANVVFEIRRTGQSVLLATADAMNLYKGNFYTIWCGGYINGSDAAGTGLRIDAFIH
ncbi:MAG: DUF4397 domain-containing protein [Niabella sp.]